MNKYIFTLAMVQLVAMAQNDFEIDDGDFMEEDFTSRSAERYKLPRGSLKYPARHFSAHA